MPHYLYLVRHGEQQDAEHGMPDGPLSARGKRQATLIAERLSGVPFTSMYHSPLRRAQETAKIMAERLPALSPEPSSLLFDCIPSGPSSDMPKAFESFFGGVTEAEIEAGSAQMSDAVSEFLTPARADRHDLLITHNFVIGWFVRHVFDAPEWRWLGLNQANCGLTIIRVRSAKPPVLVVHNDLGHLPVELRTGMPELQPV
ncbi:histidine phosphatase family protein [Planctomonas sp. JC2975]|uniref:histidine phosphatase family protein n=1 Tax=Planctomonas sp. JC2975 TaxID=2729626 RepID=UPI001474B6CF|nr:histidine phosphatase family protein [Planctomonas sp. JC2975]NNC13345.1 histidine phosphatase family protein [Planctomonas sp. JC2975]